MKHTPGPWDSTTRQGSWDWVVFQRNDPNIEICQMFHDGTDFNETGEANSLLVAAAPDLLEALKRVVAVADRKTNEFDAARAAIAKATGGH